jgi:hypothetical protein
VAEFKRVVLVPRKHPDEVGAARSSEVRQRVGGGSEGEARSADANVE